MKIESQHSNGGRNTGTTESTGTTLSLTKSAMMRIMTGVQPQGAGEATPADSLKGTGVAGSQTDTIKVRFLLDSGFKFTTAFESTTTIAEIREKLANLLEVDKEAINPLNEKGKITDTVKLRHLATEPQVVIAIRLESTAEKTAMIEERVRKYIPSLNVITAHVQTNEEYQVKDLVVEIENQCCQKEWLGGYRNKLSGVEYHNASTQTKLKFRRVHDHSLPVRVPLLFHRDTQTLLPPRDNEVITTVSTGTQMWRRDCYIPSEADRILAPRPYRPSSVIMLPKVIEDKAIVIQRAVRDWIHGKRFLDIIKLEKKLNNEKKIHKLQMIREQDMIEREIITSAVYPSRRVDFYVLYLMVEKWLNKDWDRILKHRTEVPKRACQYISLQKEINFLFHVEKHIIQVKKESLKKEDMRFLEMTSRPNTFKNSKGQITSVDDTQTQTARAFKEMYSQLIHYDIEPKHRIDFLCAFKQLFSLQYLSYEYCNDIVSLVDREIDLILMGMKAKDLKALRMRIEQLFLHFLRQKEFNPKAAKYKKPNWPKTVDKLYQCNRCQKLLPPSKFPVHIRMKAYKQCTSCEWVFNIGHHRVDMGPFLKMLRQVQRSEMECCCYSSVCFLMQQIGMAHLTTVIWHGHSAISECADITRLRHIRWLSDVEWAPWNTILLTNHEAKCHMSIPDVFQFYHKSFINMVQQRHMKARITFTRLLEMDHYLRSTGAWQNVNDSGCYFHPSHSDMFASQNEYDRF